MGTAATARQRLLAQLPDDKREREAFAARQVLARAHEVTRPSRSRKLARDWGTITEQPDGTSLINIVLDAVADDIANGGKVGRAGKRRYGWKEPV